jgi:hypothetical protein
MCSHRQLSVHKLTRDFLSSFQGKLQVARTQHPRFPALRRKISIFIPKLQGKMKSVLVLSSDLFHQTLSTPVGSTLKHEIREKVGNITVKNKKLEILPIIFHLPSTFSPF